MDKNDITKTLDRLVETSKDGEFGFQACAEHAKDAALRQSFLTRAADCRQAASELQSVIRTMGETPEDGGTAGGAMHRGWVAVKGTLAGYTDLALLEEAERGEDVALGAYRKALKEDLPADIRMLVQRQADGAQRNHDQIRALRDQARAMKV
ncbi:PA2169 family four-helix-bundle protein [Ideonella azotifigens]|uniref:PA2169 family four-helix-bundle protein n=1 Tax=Ideonella azotifigens TaxID=513160 RepID=A0ABN1KKE5_9BURK|nr:PA2169 family four-helix-bundle protein [Ideonella azotifigens]MCD2339308.1 PA2169 family four-helix-bundle protein [Ideonella azotifigens]